VGAVAEPLGDAYGIGLGLVGVFTTSLFLVHALVQIPAGRQVDRYGAHLVLLGSLLLVAGGNALLMAAAEPALGIGLRALVGLGTGAAFVAGSDYVRAAGGGPVAQGLYGGSAMAGGGLALAVVPALHGALDWRAPYAGAVAAAVGAVLVLSIAPRPPLLGGEGRANLRGLLCDRRLDRLSVAHMAALGLNAVVANWTVTLLTRAGGFTLGVAGVVSALTLAGGIAGRPLGGWLALRSPGGGRGVVAVSLALGAAGTALLIPARPLPLVLIAAALVGVGAGLAFAPVFAAAAGLRPEEPAAAVGLVNMAGNLVIVAGTPLLGLTFALPGDGRLGFAAAAALWAAALLALPRRFELADGEVTETSEAGIRVGE
jgi:MFS family permease